MRFASLSVMLILAVFIAPAAFGQTIALSAGWDWDTDSGDVQMWVSSSYDYSAAYYYNSCLHMELNKWDANLNFTQEYYADGPCSFDTYNEFDGETNVTPSEETLQFIGDFDTEIVYQVYQFDEYCGLECEKWFDAFGFFLYGGGGYGGSVGWDLAGVPPDYSDEQEDTTHISFAADLCPIPSSEVSTYLGPGALGGYSAGVFVVGLLPATTTFGGMSVAESFENVHDGCFYSGAGVPHNVLGSPGSWPVLPDNTYGYDGIGLNTANVGFFQDAIRTGAAPYTSCDTFNAIPFPAAKQIMDIYCSERVNYDPGHPVGVLIQANSAVATRGGASGSIY